MKKLFITLMFILFSISFALANGVAIIDVNNGYYLRLLSSEVEVTVENQVAIVTVKHVFKNNLSVDKKVKFGFPMPENGSATELKFKVSGQWYLARFAPTPQDNTLPGPGGEIDANLKQYLGETPLYYDLAYPVKADSLLTIKLTYVQLLPYQFGKVEFNYHNDYRLLQTYPLDMQKLYFRLASERSINSAILNGITPTAFSNDGHTAVIEYLLYEAVAQSNYHVQYELSLNELGLYSMSTFLPDTLTPDLLGQGFFTFIAEPDPSENASTINKYFTLIVDRSGSMNGSKIEQARNAAKFIVENLNAGDKFNIVDFSSDVKSFRPAHVDFNEENKQAALTYISYLWASGGTNISGAFDKAVPQFSAANDSSANIIIFFTDGKATVGITNTNDLLAHVQSQIEANQAILSLFNFGIGNDANKQLLTLLASENNGLADFLGSDELEAAITEFYLTIRNPVLLNTQMSFIPDVIVRETYPVTLPNLYKGQQLLISGRYQEAIPITLALTGKAYGKDARYEYQMNLADSTIDKNRFLTKIWAKQKIEHLLVQYYSLPETDAQAKIIKTQVIEVSLKYGVLSPFTSLSGDDPTAIRDVLAQNAGALPQQFEVLGNYPNPFNPATVIRFKVNIALHDVVIVKIYNALGQVVRVLTLRVNGQGVYEILWDGLMSNGQAAPSGEYFYMIDFGKGVLGGKMMLVK